MGEFMKNWIAFLNIALLVAAMTLFAGCSGSVGGQEASVGDTGTQYLADGGNQVPVTTATPPGGTYESAEIVVALECLGSCAETYYTVNTDGAQDTPNILYTGPITLATDTNCVTLRFYSTGGEAVKTETYYLYPSSVSYSVGGAVSGLAGTVVLQNNSGDDLNISTDGAFMFATAMADGAAYNVTVLTQPTGQACSVSNGSGTISGASVASVSVTCVTLPVTGLMLLDVVTLSEGTDIEARPEIYFYNDLFFIVYLYAPIGGNQHRVRIYDAGLSAVLADYAISSTSFNYGSPTDIRGKQLGNKVYLAYESVKALPGSDKESYIFLSVHNLDVSFSRLAPTENGSVLLVSSTGSGPGTEVLADPTVYLNNGSLALLTSIVTSPTGDSIHYLRKFDASTLAIEQQGEINLGTTIGIVGMGGVSNLFDNGGITNGIFRHMVAPQGPWEFKLVAFTSNFQPIAESVRTIATQGLNLQPTGFLNWSGRYFLAHSNNDTTVPSTGEEDREVWLKLFTQDFELLQAIKLGDLGIHPTLATDGEKLYLAYSSGGVLKVAIFRALYPVP